MSQAPHVVRGARWGELRLGEAGGFTSRTCCGPRSPIQCGLSMAQTAEKLAEQYGVTREEADLVALRSQQRAKQAWDEGRIEAEVAPITIQTRKGEVSSTRTSTCARTRRWRRSPRCARTSARTAWSRRATPAASGTARRRS
jgi:acetyl-CoA acetyltransferase